jgi:predicted transcriptional regulator
MLKRTFSSNTSNVLNAMNVFKESCYHKIDFTVSEDSNVNEAIYKFNAFNIGCLAVKNKNNKVIGVCSERDYIKKVPFITDNHLKIKDISTFGPNLIIARKNDSLETCMNKMMFKDIRHLLIIDDNDEDCLGMISIKDLVRELNKKNNDIITRLSDFKIGKGGYFSSE